MYLKRPTFCIYNYDIQVNLVEIGNRDFNILMGYEASEFSTGIGGNNYYTDGVEILNC